MKVHLGISEIGKISLTKICLAVLFMAGVSYSQSSTPATVQSLSSNQPTSSAQPAGDQPAADQPPAIEPVGEETGSGVDPASLVPDLPQLPHAKATLIGGTIRRLDRIQDQLVIAVFGGGDIKVLFDPRTRVTRDGKPLSPEDLKPGERIYADTILVDGNVFARNLRLGSSRAEGEGQGMVLSYNRDKGELAVRDQLSPRPIRVRVTSASTIVRGDKRVTADELVPGTLVDLKFQPETKGESIAREISILITPGTEFSFSGRVAFLDLRSGLLVVTSDADHKNHEVHFDPSSPQVSPDLREGAEVTVLTRYDGDQYVAREFTVQSAK